MVILFLLQYQMKNMKKTIAAIATATTIIINIIMILYLAWNKLPNEIFKLPVPLPCNQNIF
jgi:hypothetical protein